MSRRSYAAWNRLQPFAVEGVRNHPIVICLDSRAALMALDRFLITSKEVLKCRELMKELTVNNSVNDLWVLGHSNILANEKSDRLVNKGSKGVKATHCSGGVPSYNLEERLRTRWKKDRKAQER